MLKKVLLAVLAVSLWSIPSYSCTSVIIAGRGGSRPVMLKHRDTQALNNCMEWFQGERYAFIGLVNARSASIVRPRRSAWAGTNEAGFCIMNTAAYDFKDDDVPESMMDQEGVVMYRALSVCKNTADFEHFLDTLRRPMRVETNFGVIDAEGGAAYYEVNNHRWVKFDVAALPEGYMVVTNFTRMGREAERKGVDRFERASHLIVNTPGVRDHRLLLNLISRDGAPILRDISASSVCFEGVRPGEDPFGTVMWTVLGYPVAAAYVPLMVLDGNHIPAQLRPSGEDGHAWVCDRALELKKNKTDALDICRKTERFIDKKFPPLQRHRTDHASFIRKYDRLMDKYMDIYERNFREIVR